MRAILINEDKSLTWSSVPDPEHKDGEIIIEGKVPTADEIQSRLSTHS